MAPDRSITESVQAMNRSLIKRAYVPQAGGPFFPVVDAYPSTRFEGSTRRGEIATPS